MPLAQQALVGLRLRGQQVQAAVTVFSDEVRRRSAVRLGAVDSRALLTVLHDLPTRLPVPLRSLDAHALRLLRTAPPGVVDVDDDEGTAVRLLAPAARVELVLTPGPHGTAPAAWDEAVRDASQFAPFCARGVLLARRDGPEGHAFTQSDPHLDLLLLKARFYGVGVAEHGLPGPDWLLAPAPYRPQRHSPAQWLFHEQAWSQFEPVWS
jgi:hypothetical protein